MVKVVEVSNLSGRQTWLVFLRQLINCVGFFLLLPSLASMSKPHLKKEKQTAWIYYKHSTGFMSFYVNFATCQIVSLSREICGTKYLLTRLTVGDTSSEEKKSIVEKSI